VHEIQNNYDHNKHNNSENVQWKKKKEIVKLNLHYINLIFIKNLKPIYFFN